MASKIQVRRDLASVWTLVNPVLSNGEFGYEIDTKKIKIGDGETEWDMLPYMSSDSGININGFEFTDSETGAILKFKQNELKAGANSTSYFSLKPTGIELQTDPANRFSANKNGLSFNDIEITAPEESGKMATEEWVNANVSPDGGDFTNILGDDWSGNNIITLTTNRTLVITSTKSTGFLLVKQDGAGGHSLNVGGVTFDISTVANNVSMVGYVKVGNDLYFSISDGLITGSMIPEITPTFNMMSGVTDSGNGVINFPAPYLAVCSIEPINGNGYVDLKLPMSGSILFGLDDNNTLNIADRSTPNNWKSCIVLYNNDIYAFDGTTPLTVVGIYTGSTNIRLERVGNILHVKKSNNNGNSYTDVYTFTTQIPNGTPCYLKMEANTGAASTDGIKMLQ